MPKRKVVDIRTLEAKAVSLSGARENRVGEERMVDGGAKAMSVMNGGYRRAIISSCSSLGELRHASGSETRRGTVAVLARGSAACLLRPMK